MSRKSTSIIAYLWMKIYQENPSDNHDVPLWQNACNWAFRGQRYFLYTVLMYFSLYNGVQWKWMTKATTMDQLWLNHHDSSKFVPLWQNPFYGDFKHSNRYLRPATTEFAIYKTIFVSQSYIVSLISTKMKKITSFSQYPLVIKSPT